MEIIMQTIPTMDSTISYIREQLEKIGTKSRINLSLDLTRPEYIMAKKTANGFDLDYIRGEERLGSLTVLSSDPEKYIRALLESIVADDEKKKFEDRCYKLYQLEWMISHGKSLDDLYKVMLEYEQDMFDSEDFGDGEYGHGHEFDADDLERAALQARDVFLFERGFGNGEIYVSEDEFLRTDYLDSDYMKFLFETQVDTEADKMKALYKKYTGKDVNQSLDLKMHTLAGDIRVYRNFEPHYQGIKVTLKPSGFDDEVLMAVIENCDGLDMNIHTYADAENDEPTNSEVLSRDSIDAAYKKIGPEELRRLIFDEWKRFTFYDGENIPADEIDNVPKELLDEIAFRCDSLETDDISQNIRACLQYAKVHGTRALIKEMDDCNIWRYIG